MLDVRLPLFSSVQSGISFRDVARRRYENHLCCCCTAMPSVATITFTCCWALAFNFGGAAKSSFHMLSGVMSCEPSLCIQDGNPWGAPFTFRTCLFQQFPLACKTKWASLYSSYTLHLPSYTLQCVFNAAWLPLTKEKKNPFFPFLTGDNRKRWTSLLFLFFF